MRTLRVFRNLNLPASVTTSRAETHMVVQVPRENALGVADEAAEGQAGVPKTREKRTARRWLRWEKAKG